MFDGKSSSAYTKHCFRVSFMQKNSDAFLMPKISKYYEHFSKRKFNHLNWGYIKIIAGEILFSRCETLIFVPNLKKMMREVRYHNQKNIMF